MFIAVITQRLYNKDSIIAISVKFAKKHERTSFRYLNYIKIKKLDGIKKIIIRKGGNKSGKC